MVANGDAPACRDNDGPGGTVYDIFDQDWFYIVLIIVIFAALWLLVRGVERFER